MAADRSRKVSRSGSSARAAQISGRSVRNLRYRSTISPPPASMDRRDVAWSQSRTSRIAFLASPPCARISCPEMSEMKCRYRYCSLSSIRVRFLLWFCGPNRLHPRNKPSSRGILKRGRFVIGSSATAERSLIPNRHSWIILSILERRKSPASSSSNEQRATNPRS